MLPVGSSKLSFLNLQEPISFSLRQIQLAKHTPSQIILLAYWCAMLERYSNKPSKRLEDITSFLEQAVKIVPIESILFAIGHDELNIAVDCAKALVCANTTIPYSQMALEEACRAGFRMRTGLPGTTLDEMVYEVVTTMDFFSLFVPFPHLLGAAPPFGTGSPLGAAAGAPQSTASPLSASAPLDTTPPLGAAAPLGTLVPTYSAIVQHGSLQQAIQHTLSMVDIPFEDVQNFPVLAGKFDKMAQDILSRKNPSNERQIISNLSLDRVYPVHPTRRGEYHLKSPIDVLTAARDRIEWLLETTSEDLDSSTQGTQTSNELMLHDIKEINDHSLRICTSLIGSFMEQQICIPLLKSEADTANILSKEKSSPVQMGGWALFSLGFNDLQKMLERMQGDPLFVQITDYISGIVDDDLKKSSNHQNEKYAAKLQFLLQGMRGNTISCSSQYISYSLEHQLCSNLKFKRDITVKKLVEDWKEIFKGDALSLVAKTHRPLVARWLKWAVIVHDLRESLAKYTCVGVTGLVNSGKSRLVSSLFDLQVSCTAIS